MTFSISHAVKSDGSIFQKSPKILLPGMILYETQEKEFS